MPVIPDIPWTAAQIGPGPGVVYVTHLHLRRLRDVPAFMRTSLAIRAQAIASPGARSVTLRALPLARRFTTVSWWDDEGTAWAFVRADPHRAAMARWRAQLLDFGNRAMPGTPGEPPRMSAAVARGAVAP